VDFNRFTSVELLCLGIQTGDFLDSQKDVLGKSVQIPRFVWVLMDHKIPLCGWKVLFGQPNKSYLPAYVFAILRFAIARYFFSLSMPMTLLAPWSNPATSIVPLPQNGSSRMPPGGKI
jgi:hypothetical protein